MLLWSQLHQSYIFSGQLSFEKLENSWYGLVHAWPILFARIRRDKESPSGLSYHIPTRNRIDEIRREAAAESLGPKEKRTNNNDKERKPFYTLDKGSQSVSDYFSGLKKEDNVSKPDDAIFTTLAPKKSAFDSMAKANSPKTFKDYLEGDFPLISIQVTRFADATMITHSNSHIYGDAFTMVEVLRAWQAILDGKGLPAKMQDVGVDPFAHLGPSTTLRGPPQEVPSTPKGWRILNFRDKVYLIARLLYDLKVSRPESTLQQRYIFLPVEVTNKLQAEAKADLATMSTSKEESQMKLGKSDVLYAWLLKTVHAASTPSTTTMVTPVSIINLKGRSPPSGITFPRHSFFCSALPVPLQSFSTAELMKMSLGQVALHVRKSHQIHLDPVLQVDSIRFHLHHGLWKQPSGQTPLFCPPHHRWFGLSDHRALRYFEINFHGALPSQSPSSTFPSSYCFPIIEGETDTRRDGRLLAKNIDMTCAMSKRDRFLCLGDSDEGTWFTGSLSKDQWEDPRGFGKYAVRQ